MTKGDDHAVTGIIRVEVGVDFDLYANAALLEASDNGTAQTAAVLALTDAITWKPAAQVYKAKYLRPDATWGRRDAEPLNNGAAAALLKPIGADASDDSKAKVTASYGGTWADKVIAVDFAPLPNGVTAQALWDDYFDYVYGGYVEDLATGERAPLIWLQTLFSHRAHTNLEVVVQRANISMLDGLSGSGDFRVAIYADGFEDLIVDSFYLTDYEDSAATIEQGSAFYSDGSNFLNSSGAPIPGNELHVTGLSAVALAEFEENGGLLLKGTETVPANAYDLELEEEDGEIAIKLWGDFFAGAFQGSYTLKINSEKVFKTPSFAVNRLIDRPNLVVNGSGYVYAATTDTAPAEITTADFLSFDNAFYAAAVVTSGRSVSSVVVNGTNAAVPNALQKVGGLYVVDGSALTEGTIYKLTVVTANFADPGRANLNSVVYYIKVIPE
jgi:hypothetical protein